MPAPLVLMAAGSVTSVLSRFGANLQQAIAERVNAGFFRQQQEFARLAAERAEGVAAFDYTHKMSEQMGAYAAGGVDMSGSAAVTVGGTMSNAIDEIMALRKKGEIDVRLAGLRSQQAGDTARTLSSFGYNFMQGASTLLNNPAVQSAIQSKFGD